MVKHQVLVFAGIRARVGADHLEIELPEEATVAELLAHVAATRPELAGPIGRCRVAVQQEFVDPEHVLAAGDEIALIPPVSGGTGRPPPVLLAEAELSLDDVVACVRHRGAGGIATFTGNVRGQSRGQEIVHLEYEAYGSMAIEAMGRIVRSIEEDVPGTRVAIHHRIGRLEVGETAVVIAASAPHRAEAFAACRAAIEALKRDVPIWKKEVGANGSVWIAQGP
jgi:molybdopterin synthase catalytic subunit